MNISIDSLRLALDTLKQNPKEGDAWNTMIKEFTDEIESMNQINAQRADQFIHQEVQTYGIPHIDECVAALCAHIDEPITVSVKYDSDKWGLGDHQLRIHADIYGIEREELLEDFGQSAVEAYDDYKSSECDNQLRYDGDYNWASLGSDVVQAEMIMAAYVAEQRKRYPLFDIRIA